MTIKGLRGFSYVKAETDFLKRSPGRTKTGSVYLTTSGGQGQLVKERSVRQSTFLARIKLDVKIKELVIGIGIQMFVT